MKPPSRASVRVDRAFTLVELLVVIGIIALLISILLPTLNRARQASQSVACKSMLRQFALAAEMYINDSRGWCVDVNKLYDYDNGLVKYMSQKNQMSERIARCPGDQGTEGAGRLGIMGLLTGSVNYRIKNAEGNEYEVKVSIGANENSTSASQQVTGGGTSARWLRRSAVTLSGADPTKTMTFADYQYNRGEPAATAPLLNGYMSPVVGPGNIPPGSTANDKMGSLVFRHRNSFNAAFLDGHVGEIRVNKKLKPGGHDLADGENWGTLDAGKRAERGLTAYPTITSFGSLASHKIFYPFGPAPTGMVKGVYGTMEGWEIN